MTDYDAVVIGAGNGGLAAAAHLAQRGLSVLLLERHNVPGGCATSFVRGRFEFEVALHQLSGLGSASQPGPLWGILQKLDVLGKVDFVEEDAMYRFVVPGNSRSPWRRTRSRSKRPCRKNFPPSRRHCEIHRFCLAVLRAVGGHFFHARPGGVQRKVSDFLQVCIQEQPGGHSGILPRPRTEIRHLRLLRLCRASAVEALLHGPGHPHLGLCRVQALSHERGVPGPFQRHFRHLSPGRRARRASTAQPRKSWLRTVRSGACRPKTATKSGRITWCPMPAP